MKKRLYLCHAQGRYGENVYAPFSVGVLWAYARTFKEITDAYEMVDFLYLKEPIADAVARLDRPDVLGLAHYIWNAEWNKEFARAVKAKWPNCTIIVGGVQVPDESPRILQENPDFDFAIYGEGEGAFADFLREHIRKGLQGVESPYYMNVGSLIYRSKSKLQGLPPVLVNPRRPFVDLAELRSPYLDGVFDDLWPREPRWQVLVEYDRGCGVGCHFCAWGQAALNKLRLFPEDRIRAELEWFGQHKVQYIDQADANFAVIKRDIALTQALVRVKEKYGYPKTFRTSFAKNSNETVWEVANLLNDADMLKSVTLAMQSMDDDVLVAIHRKNIKYEKFGELIKRYEAAGIPTYTELILGLPQETLDTFLDGIEKNLEAGQHSGLFVYQNSQLENTEQNKPEYIVAHGLRAVEMQAMLTHGTPDSRVVRERQRTIVETATMPHADWKRAFMHSKVVEIFHAQGLLQSVAIALHECQLRLPYRDFYAALLDWYLAHPDTVAGREVVGIARLLDNVLAGGLWDCVDPRLGDISWPPEEFAFARICLDLDRFYDEIEPFAHHYFYEYGSLWRDVWPRQRAEISRPPIDDTATWARDVVWYGRKGSGTKMRRAS